MGWVDINDTTGIVTVDYGQAGRDVANAPSNAVNAVSGTVGNAVDTVTAPVTNFIDKGQSEGYGEAVWQDVVQPIGSAMPDHTISTVAGAGSALALDLLNPKPGINPMNIAGGALGGYAGGLVGELAFDTAQALSNPNSMLRGSTYSKALEGAGIASGITGDTKYHTGDDLIDRGANIINNVSEGIGNIYQGGLAGADQLGADVAGFFGFDKVEDMYQVLANDRRKAMDKNSAVGAVAEEAMYDAGMGGVLGKGVETLGAVGKGIGRWANSNVINKGSKYVDEILDMARTKTDDMLPKVTSAIDEVTGKITKESKDALMKRADIADGIAISKQSDILGNTMMFPGAQVITDTVGKVSPKTGKWLEDSWDDIAAYVFGGKDASLRAYQKMLKDANSYGLTPKQAENYIKKIADNPKITEPMKKVLTSPTSPGLSKLLGTTTAITADVEDY
jgi:hypothetical protein